MDIEELRLLFQQLNITVSEVNLGEKLGPSRPPGIWESMDNDVLVYTFLNPTPRTKVAAFDLNGTIIKTKSGDWLPKNSDDWELNFSEIPQKFNELVKKDFRIVIFTNDRAITSGTISRSIEVVATLINVPLQVFVAKSQSLYRKPAPGMWNALSNQRNGGLNIDISNSFYVGDAAGCVHNWAPKKNQDPSCVDRLFAINMGLKFYTPEEYFVGARTVQYVMPTFDPRNIISCNEPPIIRNICEIIVIIGCGASGKRFYCKEHLVKNGYAHLYPDPGYPWEECAMVIERLVRNKQSVVVNNKSINKKSRSSIILLAKRLKVPCRCFLMTTSSQHSNHNKKFRDLTDKNRTRVGEESWNHLCSLYKRFFEEPTVSEGFEEVVKVDCIPKFDDVEREKLYKMFLLET